MKFTLVFSSPEAIDLSYGLVFIPSPVWMQGEREILNLNPEHPDYRLGSFRRLLECEPIVRKLFRHSCVLVVHHEGLGTDMDLHTLLDDLQGEGFQVEIYNFGMDT